MIIITPHWIDPVIGINPQIDKITNLSALSPTPTPLSSIPSDSDLALKQLTSIDEDSAIIARIGFDRPPIAIPIKIRASEILSKLESRNAPLGVDLFNTLATQPSTTSKKPEIRSNILAIICEGNIMSFASKNFEMPNKILDKMAKANAIALQNVGDKPSEPNLFPISVVIGTNLSLNLLSKQ